MHYTLPFPLLLDVHTACVSVDFMVHRPTEHDDTIVESQRGTDIMYVDLLSDKIQRIDTLRHTLHQPAWVKHHFTIN
jgi:hypothetical protein